MTSSPELDETPWVLLLRPGSVLPLLYVVATLQDFNLALPATKTFQGSGVLAVTTEQEATATALRLSERLLPVTIRKQQFDDPDPAPLGLFFKDVPSFLPAPGKGMWQTPGNNAVREDLANTCQTLATSIPAAAASDSLHKLNIPEPLWPYDPVTTEAYRLLHRPAVIDSWVWTLQTAGGLLLDTQLPETFLKKLATAMAILTSASAEHHRDIYSVVSDICTAASTHHYVT